MSRLDEIVVAAHAHIPGHAVQFLFWDDDQPGVTLISIGESATSDYTKNRVLRADSATADILDEYEVQSGVMAFILRVHTDMLLGSNGKIMLGAVGVCFLLSIVSGVVVYGPPMRRLRFAQVRRSRAPQIYWLDLHNALGIVVASWLSIVAATGALNAFADLTLKYWQYDQLAER